VGLTVALLIVAMEMTSTIKILNKFSNNLELQARADTCLKEKVLILPAERSCKGVVKIRHPMRAFLF